jgi:hypothetical protein
VSSSEKQNIADDTLGNILRLESPDDSRKIPLQFVVNHDKFLCELCVNKKKFTLGFLSVQTIFLIFTYANLIKSENREGKKRIRLISKDTI